MSPSFSTKVLLFSGLSLLQISKNFVDLAQVSALTFPRINFAALKQFVPKKRPRIPGMSKCREPHVLESFQVNSSESEQHSEDLQQNDDPADAENGAGNSTNSNEAGMSDSYAKMLESKERARAQGMGKEWARAFLQGIGSKERAVLLRKLLIDLRLNFLDGSRLEVNSKNAAEQNAAFKITGDGAQETSAASTLVRAQSWKTVGDLKTWLASVTGKSKYFIDVFLPGTEMPLEDTQTLEKIDAEIKSSNEASNNTGPVSLFVVYTTVAFSKDDKVQDFLEQYSTRLKNFAEIKSSDIAKKIKSSVGSTKQKNSVTVRIKRDDIDTSNTKTSTDDDSSTFYEITIVRQRTSYFSMRGGVVDDDGVFEDLYIVFEGARRPTTYYDVMNDSWSFTDDGFYGVGSEVGETRLEVNEDASFKKKIGFRAQDDDYTLDIPGRMPLNISGRTLNIPDLGEMTWSKLFTTFLIYATFNADSDIHCGPKFSDFFPGHLKELLIPTWKDFAVEFHNESANTRPETGFMAHMRWEPVPDSQRLFTKTDAGEVKIYDSDRQYYDKVEEKVGENWKGLRIADVTFKKTIRYT